MSCVTAKEYLVNNVIEISRSVTEMEIRQQKTEAMIKDIYRMVEELDKKIDKKPAQLSPAEERCFSVMRG